MDSYPREQLHYGHGNNNLCSIMGSLMMLAFLIDQISELCDTAFQKARTATKRLRYLWKDLFAVFHYFVCCSWDEVFDKIVLHRRRLGLNSG